MPSGRSGALSNRLACSVVASDTKRTLHRKGIGSHTLEAGPGDRSCNRKSLARARRVGADRGGAAAIAQVIKKNTTAADFVRREDIVLRISLGQGAHQPAGPTVGLVVRQRVIKRRHEVDAFATS